MRTPWVPLNGQSDMKWALTRLRNTAEAHIPGNKHILCPPSKELLLRPWTLSTHADIFPNDTEFSLVRLAPYHICSKFVTRQLSISCCCCNMLPSCDGLYILGPGSGTIWRCGLVGIGVTWLEWVCHCGCGYKILTLVAWKSVFH